VSLDISLYVNCEDAGDGEQHTLTLFESNMTHNVSPMWREAGCFDALYESHGQVAGRYIEALNAAVASMSSDPARYRALDPKNGWGSYVTAFPWLQEVRNAFERYPKAKICVSR
jgi:hypothetical protein